MLKYLVLTTLLMKSDINPFDSQETKPYRNDPRISAMTDLVDAYQRDDMHKYESILQNNKDVLADPFIAENIDEVTRNMRTKGVFKVVAPYTRFTLAFVAKQLNISVTEVEDIIGFLIVDGKLKGRINQSNGTVEIIGTSDGDKTVAMQEWTNAIGSLCRVILDEAEGFKAEESAQGLYSGGSMGNMQSSTSGVSAHFINQGSSSGLGKRTKGAGRKGGFVTSREMRMGR